MLYRNLELGDCQKKGNNGLVKEKFTLFKDQRFPSVKVINYRGIVVERFDASSSDITSSSSSSSYKIILMETIDYLGTYEESRLLRFRLVLFWSFAGNAAESPSSSSTRVAILLGRKALFFGWPSFIAAREALQINFVKRTVITREVLNSIREEHKQNVWI